MNNHTKGIIKDELFCTALASLYSKQIEFNTL